MLEIKYKCSDINLLLMLKTFEGHNLILPYTVDSKLLEWLIKKV